MLKNLMMKYNKDSNMREIAEQLWILLDKIDTLSDVCKPTIDNPKSLMAFYNNTMKYVEKRFELLKSDGYSIYTNEEYETLPKPEISVVKIQKDIGDSVITNMKTTEDI